MKQPLKVFSLANNGLTGKRPFEDALKYDVGSGAFAVADGVTLWEGIEYQGRYPKRSGSAKLARAFCDGFVRYHKQNPSSDFLAAFRAGNRSAARVNIGRSKYHIFREHKGLFAATVTTAIVTGRRLDWAHICDAGVAVITKDGKLKMKKDDCRHSFPWFKDTKQYEASARTFFIRTIVRNAIGPDGQLQGYGVVTGEPEAERYIESGKYSLLPGESAVLFSDGFASYLELPAFRKLIARATSEKEFRMDTEKIIREKTRKIRRKIRGKKIDWLASVEIIQRKFREILGKDVDEFKWAKEKSIIIIKPD
jgi:serine/threonine protein phosphatase PrpC